MTGQAEHELLRLEGIGVRLDGREILRDVSFAVKAGEFTGLIGPNGAGKTTLLKVILGLQAPTSGRVLLNGGLGAAALFLYLGTQTSSTTGASFTILFGSMFVISPDTVPALITSGLLALAVVAVLSRVLLLTALSPEIAAARGVRVRAVGVAYLAALAVAVALSAVVIGAVLSTALLIGPAAAARSFTRRPGHAIAVATSIALVTVWAGIALSYRTNWPLGFYVGAIAAGFFLLGQGWAAVRRRGSAARPLPALSTVQ
jgi:zinc/manganese transport system permease protein